MGKKSKRCFRVLLSMCLVVGMLVFSGCSGPGETGSDENTSAKTNKGDIPVLQMLIPTSGNTADLPLVQEAINEILVEKTGARVNLMMTNMGSLDQQLNLMLTSEGDLDITYVSGNNVKNYVRNGQLKDLTDYYSNSGEEFRSIFPEFYYKAGTIDGKIYSFPVNRNFSSAYCFMVNKKMADAMELNLDKEDPSRVWTFDEIRSLATQAKEKYPDVYPVVPMSGNLFIGGWTWDGLGDSYNLGVLEDCGQKTQVINITQCKDFVDWCHEMREWYEAGLIMEDSLSNTEYYATLFTANKAFGAFNSIGNPHYDPADPDNMSYQLMLVPNWIASDNVTYMSYAIAAGSKNPDLAWTVLEELYTNDEIGTLLKYGIEGKNYQLNDEGKVTFLDGQDLTTCTYTVGWASPWFLPNWAKGKLAYNQKDGYYDAFRTMDDAALASKALGCVFDSSEVINEYTACANVYDKYYKALICGSVNPDSTLKLFEDELVAAGVNKIIESKQKQVDAFLHK